MKIQASKLSPVDGYVVNYAGALAPGALCSYSGCSYGDETPAPATCALSLGFTDGTRTVALCRGCAHDLRRLLGRIDREAKVAREGRGSNLGAYLAARGGSSDE